MEIDQNKRPSKVNLAVKLLYISVILGIILMLAFIALIMYVFWKDGRLGSTVVVISSLTFFTLLFSWLYFLLIRKAGKGSNWARILICVIILLLIPSTISGINYWLSMTTTAILGIIYKALSILSGATNLAINLMSFILLCSKDSRLWFKPTLQVENE